MNTALKDGEEETEGKGRHTGREGERAELPSVTA